MKSTLQQEPPAPGEIAHPGAFELNEFQRGWKMLVLAVLGITTSVTAAWLYVFGTFVVPMEQNFHWSRSDIQATITYFFCGQILANFLIGWLNLRFGLRRVTLVSMVLTILWSLYFFFMPKDGSVLWLYFGYALLPVLGIGNMPVTWTQVIGLWFVRNRGLALSIALTGTAIAAGVLPSLMTWTIGRWDLRSAFLVMALPIALLALPLTWFWFKPTPPSAAKVGMANTFDHVPLTGMTFKEALRTRKFWIFNLSLVIVVSAVISMVTSMVPMLQDKGFSATDASRVFAAYGGALMLGRVVVGYLLDRLWAPGVAAVALAMPALGCLLIASSETSMPMMMLAAGLVGMGAGAEFDLSSFLLARYFGMRDYGRLYGLHLVCITVLAATSPLMIGALFKLNGNYSLVLVYCTVVFFGGAAALLLLGRHPKFEPRTAS